MSARVISFHYNLTGPEGQPLDSSEGRPPLTFIEGKGQIIPGLETELGKLKIGDKKRLHIKAEAAYGPRNSELMFDVPRERFPMPQIHVGDRFRSEHTSTPLMVTHLSSTHVTLDANHPLAGMDLTFDVDITNIRDATPEEMADCGHNCCGNHSRACCGEDREP